VDDRKPVRVSSVDALSSAILDRHTLAVPSAVMIRILQDIIIPTIQFLGEDLLSATDSSSGNGQGSVSSQNQNQGEQVLQEVLREDSEKRLKRSPSKNADNDDEAKLESSSSHNKDDEDFPEGVLNRVLGSVTPTRELEVGPAMECMSSLCKAFLQQIKKLAVQPTFDSLWISLLDLLSFFLLSPEHGGKFDKVVLSKSPETVYTIDLCYDHLRTILHSLASVGLFGNQHRARWGTTYDKVLKLSRGSRVFIEVFDDCRRDAAPVPKANFSITKIDNN